MPAPLEPGPIAPVGPGRFRRALETAGTSVGFTLIFASALVVSVAVHLDLAPTRRVVRTIANLILGTTFKGTIVVGEIDRLNLHGIRVRSATAFDPSGAQVARLDGIRADTEVLAIGKSALGDTLRVPVPIIHIDDADIALDRGESGAPSIADTFLLRNPGKPPPPGAKSPIVSLSRIEIGHVHAHGAIAPPMTLDVRLRDFGGSVNVSDQGVSVDVGPVRLEASAPTIVPQPLAGNIGFRLRVPPTKASTPAAPPRIEADFRGKLGDLDLSLDASLEGQHVAAKVAVPRATPEIIASLLPDPKTKLPLRAPVSLLVTAEGDLPDIGVDVKIGLENAGDIAVNGKVSASAPPTIDLGFTITRLDPRAVLDVPSATPLDASGHVKLSLGADLAIEVDASTKPLSIAKNPIPAVKAHAKLDRGAWSGGAQVDEPGAPTTATFSFDKRKVLRFDVDTDAKSLRAVSRLGGAKLDGSARVAIKGSIDGGVLDAKASGRVDRIRIGGAELDHANIDAHVAGPFDKLVLREAKVRGQGARAANHAFDEVVVDASGPLQRGSLRITTSLEGKDESVKADAALDLAAIGVRDIALTVKGPTGTIKGTVASVAPGRRGLEIGKIALSGDVIGDMRGDLRIEGKELVGKLHGRDVDLAKLGRIAKLPVPIGGLANIDVDLASSRQGERHGHIALEMVNGQVPGITGVTGVAASLSAVFEGDRVRLDALARLIEHANAKDKPNERCDGAIASLRISDGRGLIGGPLLDPATWKRLSGEVTIAAEDWNLRCLARLSPLPLPLDVRGKMTTRATIEMSPGARLPAVRGFLARTKGLEVDGDDFAWASKSVDVEIKGSFDPKSGVTTARIALDDGSPIASIGGRTVLDAQAFLDHPERAAAMIMRLPLSLKVRVPRRAVGAFATLPKAVSASLPPLAGEVEVEGSVEGSIEAPSIQIGAKGFGLAHAYGVGRPAPEPGKPGKSSKPAPIPESPWGVPIDLAVDLAYDGKKATAKARVVHDDHEIAKADADFAVAIADILAGRPVRPKGRADVKLTRVPLGDVPFFADRGMDGHLTGGVTLAGLGDAPTLKLDLAIPDLKIGQDLVYDDASVVAEINRGRGRENDKERGSATAAITIASKTGGKFTARAFSEILWKNAMIPTIDPERPADAIVKASKFRIAALGPFVAGVLSHVDGILDGDARVGFTRLDDDDKAKIAVQMKLSGGVFHVPQLGQELHNTEVVLKGGARGVVTLDTFRTEGTKGAITGSGVARFNGLRFAHADATFEIKKGQELPIALEGVPLGDARGKITINADRRDNNTAVVVGIPSFQLSLPTSTGRGVQGLDDNPDILILQETPREIEPRPKNPSRLALTFNIGDIGIKGNLGVVNIEMDVGLSGVKGTPLKVEVADKTRITGDIQLTRGRIVLLKRTFEIERGVVHMRPEDPGNPYLNVAARWDSPDGEIYIEYVGVLLPISKDKIKLRSPKLSEAEIVTTLLSGGAKSGGDVGGGTGQSIAQQLIAQQFSAQIAGNVSTSVGTSEDGSFRPGLVYNSGDKVIELSTYGASGAASAGGGAALKGQRTQITVDWRFWHNWSLRGKVDAGSDQTTTGVDLLWQYRY